MISKEDLLKYYFNTDVSGNDIDGMKEHYIRTNPKLITKNKNCDAYKLKQIL